MVAEIQAPIIPTRLYRYRSLSRSGTATAEEIASIRDKYLYCADFTLMNDPMEGIFRSSTLLRGAPHYRDTVRQIQDRKSGVGIACFSETYENMLMWAHYAGNFTGCCFGYSSANLTEGLPDSAVLVRLAYFDSPPRIRTSHTSDIHKTTLRILSQKHYSWNYEREWRVLADVGIVSYAPKQTLRNIYLGTRISDAQRDLLISEVVGMDVRVYQMKLEGYTPHWEEVDVPPPKTKKKKRT